MKNVFPVIYLIAILFSLTGNCIANDFKQIERSDSLSKFQSSLKGAIFKKTTELGAKEDLGGNSIGRTGYSYNLSVFAQGQVLVLTKPIKANHGEMQHVIINSLIIPKIDSTILIISDCKYDGKVDEKIVALVVDENTQFFTQVKKAWRLDLQKESIVSTPTSKIECINVSYEQ